MNADNRKEISEEDRKKVKYSEKLIEETDFVNIDRELKAKCL